MLCVWCSQQTEHHFPDGRKEIRFPDGTVRHLQPSGEERVVFPNGTVQRQDTNGDITIEFPDGQRELHTKQFKVKKITSRQHHIFTLLLAS